MSSLVTGVSLLELTINHYFSFMNLSGKRTTYLIFYPVSENIVCIHSFFLIYHGVIQLSL